MFADFDFNVIERSLPYLFRDGMVFTLKLTVCAMTGGIILGTLLAMMRLSKYRIFSIPAGMYVNLTRAIPLLLVIFWCYFLMPYVGGYLLHELYQVLPRPVGEVLVNIFGYQVRDGQPLHIGAFASTVATFTLFQAAYYCEIMRSGILSVSRGQEGASYALGLNYWQSMFYVILPQAFRNMLPVLLTQTIILFQDTSLVYVLSITDFLGAASKVAQRDGRLVEMYLFAALVYFVICLMLSFGVRRLQRNIAIVR
ncbi:MAG: ABC transporter permease subunit [Burkholderiales bacterium]|jgi:glutamate/aspartate transport system permease protein|nr:ABC transporter permease subunit [Burkholderiales bacterium]